MTTGACGTSGAAAERKTVKAGACPSRATRT